MAITATSRKRSKNPEDDDPPQPKRNRRTLKIKEPEAEPSKPSQPKTVKGKGEMVVVDLPDKKKKSTRKTAVSKSTKGIDGPLKSLIRKGKKKVGVEEDDDEDKVSDLDIPDAENAVDEEEEIEDDPVEKMERKITKSKKQNQNSDCRLTGEPVPIQEARIRWPHRYDPVKARKGGKGYLHARQHFTSAVVDGETFHLNDCCHIQAEEGEKYYIGRIVEFFETTKKEPYIAVEWFFRAEDTVIKFHSDKVDDRLIFSSESGDDNPLDCVVEKITIIQASSYVDGYNYYFNMSYSEDFCTFENLSTGIQADVASSSLSSRFSSIGSLKADPNQPSTSSAPENSEMTLLDLYAGCGGMSTGLCMGASASGVNLVTRWAVDFSPEACQSLRHNHPETEVRHTTAGDYLELLKAWTELCETYILETGEPANADEDEEDDELEADSCAADDDVIFEVDKIVGICYGDPKEIKEGSALYYKVSWKGFSSEMDTWEPATGLENCEESIKDFVIDGYTRHILPLPGTVDVICGGPPCQGISGFNRYREKDEPLKDIKNFQLEVFMNIIKFLQPRFTLMENVVDIMRFEKAYLGRLAVARLVAMQYQVRLGFLVAGKYGLPQFRMRTFIWGARTTEKLPQFPLPTHKVVSRGFCPKEFEKCNVKVDEDEEKLLKDALLLGDAIRDLPEISTHEDRDEMEYGEDPITITDFERMLRRPKHALMGSAIPKSKESPPKLYDHRPLKLSKHDNIRVSQIPQRKGANYRDLKGVVVDANNIARRHKRIKIMLAPRKPLVPEYALKYVRGTSKKPFGRLWWDEIVSTVVGRAEPHNQVILHPQQDRTLSIRENARLQGFPDYYQFFGKVKQRYIQVGNAVAVPVGRALGFALARAVNEIPDDGPVFVLPPSFSS
ncbi:DNA (cytosine-5)-methyltransferase CMT3-like [Papaver somniferum]|uniref:DNA (cytosine-5)-methyltransferase CMT3-like n=1 Tax=Papaver somniferum TaxID=3469 RepID=UPI000E6FA381|nr:DNA (cytosine-5)-methyltransferase CMT3-like [Papaver somniferum]